MDASAHACEDGYHSLIHRFLKPLPPNASIYRYLFPSLSALSRPSHASESQTQPCAPAYTAANLQTMPKAATKEGKTTRTVKPKKDPLKPKR